MFKYPVFYIFVGMMCGIILYKFHSLPFIYIIISVIILSIGIVFFHVYPQKNRFYYFEFLVFLVSVFLGEVLCSIQDKSIEKKNQALYNGENIWIEFQLIERQKTTDFYKKWLAEIRFLQDSIYWKTTKAKILVQYPTQWEKNLHIDSLYRARGKLKKIPSPLNPNVFNYSNYMKGKGVLYQFTADTIFAYAKNRVSFTEKSYEKMLLKIQTSTLNTKAKETLKALVLANRSDMSRESIQTLSLSGIIHLFAISGLHIALLFGCIYAVFSRIIGRKHLRLSIVISLFIVWLYGYCIHFPISVKRAILMLGIYYGFTLLKRQNLPYHSLSLAGIFVLIENPLQFFEVGFQLSFLAVFSIFWFYKPILNFLEKRNCIKKLHPLISVTASAQLGTTPLSVYYFHQYSLLSIICNLLIIPFAGFLIIYSFLVLLCLTLFPSEQWIIIPYNWIINLIFQWADFIVSIPYSRRENIPFHLGELLSVMLPILFFREVLVRPVSRNFLIWIICIFQFEVVRLLTTYYFYQKEEFIVFQQYKNTVFSIKKGNTLHLFATDSLPKSFHDYTLRSYLLHLNNPKVSFAMFKDFDRLKVGNYEISLGNESLTPPENNWPIYIIHHSRMPNENFLLQFPVKAIILDGSNYPNFSNEWTNRLNSTVLNGKTWNTATQGFYRLNLKTPP